MTVLGHKVHNNIPLPPNAITVLPMKGEWVWSYELSVTYPHPDPAFEQDIGYDDDDDPHCHNRGAPQREYIVPKSNKGYQLRKKRHKQSDTKDKSQLK